MRVNWKLASRFVEVPSSLQIGTAVTGVLGSPLSSLALPRAEAQSGSTDYVSPTGSDGNSGSQSYTWATITRASSIAAPRDTLIFQDGTYSIPAGGSVGGSPGRLFIPRVT